MITGTLIIVYMDDMFIFHKDLNILKENMKITLKRLRDNDLYLKPSKCEFHKTKIEYLGMVIEEGKVSMDTSKWKGFKIGRSPLLSNKLEDSLVLEISTTNLFEISPTSRTCWMTFWGRTKDLIGPKIARMHSKVWRNDSLKNWSWCHGPCSVTFFLKNNQRMAPTESPMMADSPLFSATITTGHPRRTYIRALSEYFLHSDTTNKTCIPIIVITNQHHVLSTTAQPEPHHAPHTFHVLGQSYRARTISWGHGSRAPQGLARIYVGILRHPPEYESPHYMFIILPYALQVNSLYVYVLPLYKYSSLLYVFH